MSTPEMETNDDSKPQLPIAIDSNENGEEDGEGQGAENVAIAAFGYEPAYRRVLGKMAGICIVVALAA